MFKLTTNDGIYIVNLTPTTQDWARYCGLKRAAGMALADIKFEVRPYYAPTMDQILNGETIPLTEDYQQAIPVRFMLPSTTLR